MQQKNGSQAVNCSYHSDQRGLQGVFSNSADCGHSSSVKTENPNMQPKVKIKSTWRVYFVMLLLYMSSESTHIHVTIFLFSINLCSVSLLLSGLTRFIVLSISLKQIHLFSPLIPSHVGGFFLYKNTTPTPFLEVKYECQYFSEK